MQNGKWLYNNQRQFIMCWRTTPLNTPLSPHAYTSIFTTKGVIPVIWYLENLINIAGDTDKSILFVAHKEQYSARSLLSAAVITMVSGFPWC